jgi:hypothetical protein
MKKPKIEEEWSQKELWQKHIQNLEMVKDIIEANLVMARGLKRSNSKPKKKSAKAGS